MSIPTTEQQRLVHHLAEFAHDERPNRAALAALRRGLGKQPGEAPDMFPYVIPALEGVHPRDEWAYFSVASLFGMYPAPWKRGTGENGRNFGSSFREVGTTSKSGSIEGRFVAMMNARREDLVDHLRSGVALCQSNNVAIDWARLLHDILAWDAPDRRVQRTWARSFWAAPAAADNSPLHHTNPDQD